jgi:hypothetical protein
MAIAERITYALIGAFLGALLGVACWWLYGLANSLSYYGPGIDPVLRHWLVGMGGGFSLLGLVFRERLGNIVGDTLNAIFHFEIGEAPDGRSGPVVIWLFVAIVIAVTWLTVPK